jgi:hypothetical protein
VAVAISLVVLQGPDRSVPPTASAPGPRRGAEAISAPLPAAVAVAPPIVVPLVDATAASPAATRSARGPTPDRAAKRATPRPRPTTPDPRVPAAAALGAELKLLDDALAALRAGRLLDAARRIVEHQQQFPDGALAPERDALRAAIACARDLRARAVHRERGDSAGGDPALARIVGVYCGGHREADFDPEL